MCFACSQPYGGRINIDTGKAEYPSLVSHYASLHFQADSITRLLPHQLVLYHMYLKIVHSGMTAKQILELPDEEKGQLFLEGLQVNCCAGIFPYEQDFVPCVALSFDTGVGLVPLGTEDMVRTHALLAVKSSSLILLVFFRAGRAPNRP